MSKEVSTVTGEVVEVKGDLNPFQKLVGGPGVITHFGHDLVKDDEFDDLTGVDLVITRVSVRKGAPRPEKSPWTSLDGGYMSLELLTNPEQNLKVINRCRRASGLDKLDDITGLAFDAGDSLVFNDGGTGIYRQVTEILHEHGYIIVPEGKANAPRGFSRWDTVPEEWTIRHGDKTEVEGVPFLGYTTPVLIHCTRGIRLSKYPSPFGDAKTRYLS